MQTCSFFRLATLSMVGCPQAVSVPGPARLRWLMGRCHSASSSWRQPALRFALLAALFLAYQVACAQRAPTPAAPTSPVTAAPAARDTIAVIQQVFKSRRRGGTLLLAGSAALISVAVIGSASEAKSFLGPGAIALLFAIETSPAWMVGIVKQARFSSQREQRVLADYQRLHTIPRFVRRRMRLAQ